MLRAILKRALPRLARTGPGKHLVHAATAGDRRAARYRDLESWPERVESFEDLDFLFTSSQLDHGIASLRFDEAALLFRTARSLGRARIVELGRFKGGSTLLLAVAMARGSELLSIDLHAGHAEGTSGAELDRELVDALRRYALADAVRVVVDDTRTAPLPDGALDLVFVDGDHRYEGAHADVERWSPLVRPGGHLLLHDGVRTGGWGTTYPGVQRVVAELERDARFARRPGAGTIAHFVRQGRSEA